jgi:hypothetical protein
LTVWPDKPGNLTLFAYRIIHTTTGQQYNGDHGNKTAGPMTPDEALRTLSSFLVAAGEAYDHNLRHPNLPSENTDLFPGWVGEAAYIDADELTLLSIDNPDTGTGITAEQGPTGQRSGRFISVVFLQGEEADRVVDLIQYKGTDAAIEHLSGYDFGQETVDAALENGYVYDTVPAPGVLERQAELDVYTLTYSPFLSTVALVRQYDVMPDPALLGITDPEPVTATASRTEPARTGSTHAATATPRRVDTTDWFAAPARSAASSGRGLAL